MGKMRVTTKNGVGKGNVRHNDRDAIMVAEQKGKEVRDQHIDRSRSHLNLYIVPNEHGEMKRKDPHKTLDEYERDFYQERYGKALEETNNRYIKQRHPERCKSIDQMRADRRPDGTPNKSAPDEQILQIGDAKHEHANERQLALAVKLYCEELNKWSKEHGDHLHILDAALHFDEATPHCHLRRTIDYIDKDGNNRLGIEKGLEQAGVPLPDPNAPVDKLNNRKITFDKMCREVWISVCQSLGLEIETTPLPKRERKNPLQSIADFKEQEDRNNATILANQQAIIEAQSNQEKSLEKGLEELNNMPSDVIRAIDDVLDLPAGTFATIATKAIANRQNTWGEDLTNLRQDIARDVSLYKNGILTDKDIMPKEREQEVELEH